ATRSSLTCQSGHSGTTDCAFGAGGLTTAAVSNYALVVGSTIDADGKILVLVDNSQSGFSVLRTNPDGSLDNTFGVGGVARSTFGANPPFSQPIAVQPDRAIIVVGSVHSKPNSGSPRLAAVARFRPNGTLDTGFGSAGKLLFSFGSSATNSWAF